MELVCPKGWDARGEHYRQCIGFPRSREWDIRDEQGESLCTIAGEGRKVQVNNKGALQREEEDLEDILGINKGALQAILKKSMVGSMREVLKDELQAWLGLKTKIQDENRKDMEEKCIGIEDLEDITHD